MQGKPFEKVMQRGVGYFVRDLAEALKLLGKHCDPKRKRRPLVSLRPASA